jgi:hypothetical protein
VRPELFFERGDDARVHLVNLLVAERAVVGAVLDAQRHERFPSGRFAPSYTSTSATPRHSSMPEREHRATHLAVGDAPVCEQRHVAHDEGKRGSGV